MSYGNEFSTLFIMTQCMAAYIPQNTAYPPYFIATTVLLMTTPSSHPTGPSQSRRLSITRMFHNGFELNWLPPTEPNGEVHYVIEYKREDSGNWTSVNTTSNSTHYNLTGLHCDTNYTIRVVAVNSAGQNESTPANVALASESDDRLTSTSAVVTGVVAGVVVACVIILTLGVSMIITGVVIRIRAQRREKKTTEKTIDQMTGTAVQVPEGAGEITEEENDTKEYTYSYVDIEKSAEGKETEYQELDVKTQDYVSVYTQLSGGTYQELDFHGREEEHHYQVAKGRKK